MEDESANETSPLLGRGSRAQAGAATLQDGLPWYQLRRPWHIGLLVILSSILWTSSVSAATQHISWIEFPHFLGLIRLDNLLNNVCGLIIAIPFGILADRARKPVYILASAGQVLGMAWTLLVFIIQPLLPPDLILLGALGQLLGGGFLIINVIHVSILADVLPSEQRLLGFLSLALLQHLVALASPFLSSAFQGLYVHMPLVLSLVIALLGASLIVFLPETARGSMPPQTEQDGQGQWSRFKACLHLRFRDFGPALAVAKRPNALWLMMGLTTLTLITNGYWLLFYTDIRARNDYVNLLLLSLVTRCLTLGLILPAMAILLVHPNGHARFSGYQRDLVLARISAFFGMAGVILTLVPTTSFRFLGTTMVALAIGLNALCLSLVSYLVPASGYTTVYSLVFSLQALVITAFTPFFYAEVSPPNSIWNSIIGFGIVALLGLLMLVALFQLQLRPRQPENVVDHSEEGFQGDGASTLVNDES